MSGVWGLDFGTWVRTAALLLLLFLLLLLLAGRMLAVTICITISQSIAKMQDWLLPEIRPAEVTTS